MFKARTEKLADSLAAAEGRAVDGSNEVGMSDKDMFAQLGIKVEKVDIHV